MNNGIHRIRVIKEKEKIRQVTHWDLDYLPIDEVQDLYERKTVNGRQKEKTRHASGESNQKLSLLLIMIGLFLLAASLYFASLT